MRRKNTPFYLCNERNVLNLKILFQADFTCGSSEGTTALCLSSTLIEVSSCKLLLISNEILYNPVNWSDETSRLKFGEGLNDGDRT